MSLEKSKLSLIDHWWRNFFIDWTDDDDENCVQGGGDDIAGPNGVRYRDVDKKIFG